MSRSVKVVSFVGGGFLAFLVLVILIFDIVARTEYFRSHVEAAMSRGMGMQVSVAGGLGADLFPRIHLIMHDVHVHNRGTEVAAVDEVWLGLKFLPLLRKHVEIETLHIERPHILVERFQDGMLNTMRSTPPVNHRPHGPMEITVADGSIRYQDDKSGMAVEGAGCDAKLDDLMSEPNDGRKLILRLTFTGDLDCHDARAKDFTARDLKAAMAVTPGVYAFRPITMQVYGTQGSGTLHMDLAGKPERFALQYSVPQFDVARLFEAMKLKDRVEGHADLMADLSFEGHGREDIMQSVTGGLSLKGKELTLKGYDLDGELTRFESTQKFDLLDLSAVFYAGPLGLVATKGYDYAKIKGKGGGTSHIHVLVADWQVQEGMANAEDVAMSTDRHRLALQGKVDLKDKAFDGVTVAVVDADGCPIAAQQVSGTFKQPKLQKPGVLHTLAGPVRRLVDKGKKALGRPECKVFYSGSVVPY